MAPTVKGFLSRRQRIDTLARAAARAPLAIFGRDWEGTPVASCAAAPIAFDASGGIYARSRVSLHIQRFYAHNVNDRLFNVPAAGGFLLTRAAEGIEELYEPEREIAVYRSLEELESQLHRYLADDAARERVAEAGCRRAHAHYRIERRLWEALGRCGLPRPPSSPA
jgi:spore maturation protein CgeB